MALEVPITKQRKITMKAKLAVPRNVLNAHEIELVEKSLGDGLLEVVAHNFPSWRSRVDAGNIPGGEIILQDTDTTRPIKGMTPGIHLTLSLISFEPDRNFDGLAREVIKLIKQTKDHEGNEFMSGIDICLQMSLDQSVEAIGRGALVFDLTLADRTYQVSPTGRNLLEYGI